MLPGNDLARLSRFCGKDVVASGTHREFATVLRGSIRFFCHGFTRFYTVFLPRFFTVLYGFLPRFSRFYTVLRERGQPCPRSRRKTGGLQAQLFGAAKIRVITASTRGSSTSLVKFVVERRKNYMLKNHPNCGVLCQFDAHHGEVVVGVGAVAVLLHDGGEGVDDLAGTLEVGGPDVFQHAVVAQLLLL